LFGWLPQRQPAFTPKATPDLLLAPQPGITAAGLSPSAVAGGSRGGHCPRLCVGSHEIRGRAVRVAGIALGCVGSHEIRGRVLVTR
jgi:hypothetical protein